MCTLHWLQVTLLTFKALQANNTFLCMLKALFVRFKTAKIIIMNLYPQEPKLVELLWLFAAALCIG